MISLDQAGEARSCSRIEVAPSSLDPWVEHGWTTELPRVLKARASSRRWKVVPDLSPNLLVHRSRNGTSLRLVGARTRATEIDVSERIWTAGIRLRPGTLPGLVGADARELANTSCDPARYWGDLDRLQDALSEARSAADALGLLFAFLEERPNIRGRDWRGRLLSGLPGQRPPDSVASLVKTHRVSRRTLQSASLRELGMTPKTALRIRRLYGALHAALSMGGVPWSRIAHGAGYCDGAHLSREFRALMGEEPTAWAGRGTRP
jgi:AraC-like DNA-binding protein